MSISWRPEGSRSSSPETICPRAGPALHFSTLPKTLLSVPHASKSVAHEDLQAPGREKPESGSGAVSGSAAGAGDVLVRLCEESQRLLRAEGACILEHRAGEGAVFRACSGELRAMEGASVQDMDGALLSALTGDRPAVVQGVVHCGNGKPATTSPVLVIPIPVNDAGRVALVVVPAAELEVFEESRLRMLEAVGSMAGVALEVGRVHSREKARTEASGGAGQERDREIFLLQALHRAEMAISADLELEQVLVTVAEESRRILRAEFAAVGVLDESGEGLERFIVAGDEAELARHPASPPSGRKGLLGAVLASGSAVRVNDVAADPRSAGVPEGHHVPRSFLGAPIRIGERVFGNLYVTNQRDGGFTPLDEMVLSMLAAKVAVAVVKARLFEERGRLIDRLETAGRVRSRLSSYVNHDIRNALSGILLWTERLGRTTGERPEEVAEVVRKIRKGSTHALRLVSDVLDLARLEEGRLPTWPRRFALRPLIGAAVDAVAPEAEAAGLVLEVSIVPEDLALVADPDRVLQVVNNLVGNAVKFTSRGGRVLVEAAIAERAPLPAPGPWVALSVADEGPGVAEADRERIFLGFEQGEGEAVRRRGSGLGLTLSRLLAELMDGALTLESELGKGSRFTLWLPHRGGAESREGWIG